MNYRGVTKGLIAVVACAILTGCLPTLDIETIKNMKPHRPAELDRLQALFGEWETTAKVTIAGLEQELNTTGVSSVDWDCNKRYLVEHFDFDMDELGKVTGFAVYSWDSKAKKYRIWRFDDSGQTASGTVRLSADGKKWTIKVKGNGPWGRIVSNGHLDFTDDDTIEWTWKEWDASCLIKVAEFSGTSSRKE